jgi:hypothetical protein
LLALVLRKEKQPVLDNRAADIPTIAGVVKARLGVTGDALFLLPDAQRIEVAVLEEEIGRPVKGIRAGFRDGDELPAVRPAKLSAKLIGQQREFGNGFGGNVICGPVTDLSLLSMPSTVKLLFRGRCPPTEPPVPTPKPPLLDTPAEVSARL